MAVSTHAPHRGSPLALGLCCSLHLEYPGPLLSSPPSDKFLLALQDSAWASPSPGSCSHQGASCSSLLWYLHKAFTMHMIAHLYAFMYKYLPNYVRVFRKSTNESDLGKVISLPWLSFLIFKTRNLDSCCRWVTHSLSKDRSWVHFPFVEFRVPKE